MRVVYLHMFNMNTGWGGSASMLIALHRALTGLGHRVDVVSAQKPDRFGCTVCQLPFDVTLAFGPEKRPGETTLDELSTAELSAMASRAAQTIEDELFAEGVPDLILSNHINLMALTGDMLAKKYSLPHRIVAFGTDTQLLLRDQRYCELFGDAARAAEKILPISNFIGREVAATVGGRIEGIGGAVNPELFYPSFEPAARPRSLIFMGRLVTEKGIWPLLEAFERQRAATSLTIAGEGPLRADILRYIDERGLQDRVTLLGFVPPDRLRAVLIEHALAVVPSTWQEPLGFVVLEALACSLPVVASDVGGIPEMIDHGVNGYLVPGGDAEALAGAIDEILGDPSRYAQLKAGVRRTNVPSYADLAQRVVG